MASASPVTFRAAISRSTVAATSERTGDGLRITLETGEIHINPTCEDASTEIATLTFGGQSVIVGPRGEVMALVDEPGEGYGVARIDLDQVRRYREEFQIIQSRQPATYRSLVRKY